MEEIRQDIDIKDFQSISSVEKHDNVLLALSNGTGAKMSVDLLAKILVRDVKPSIKDNVWQIGGIDTGIQAVGKTPMFQTSSNGIEWKYEDDIVWKILIGYDILKLKFSDLTPEQVQSIKLTLSDLSSDDIAELQKPATDIIQSVKNAETEIINAETARVSEENKRAAAESTRTSSETARGSNETARINAETVRVTTEKARVTEEGKRIAAESARTSSETTRGSNEAARISAETARVTEEKKRVVAENTRTSSETARGSNEIARGIAESSRVKAEQSRVTEYGTLKENITSATNKATDVASHPTIVDENGFVLFWNSVTKEYDKSTINLTGAKGEGLDYSTMTDAEKENVKGKTAYQIAVDNGYNGTEQEWLLSLNGNDGYIPIKGTDYYTESDKQELESEIISKIPTPDVSGQIETHNKSNAAHNDIRVLVEGVRSDLTNYYLKQNTYNRDEINSLIANISSISFRVVATLPISDIKTNIIYLMLKEGVAPDIYNEYIYVNGAWEIIGNTSIDLSNYVTTDSLNTFKHTSLSTTDKTILGAINEVNIKPTGVYINSRTIEDHVLTEEVLAGDLVTGVGRTDFDTSTLFVPNIHLEEWLVNCSFSSDGKIVVIAYAQSPFVKAYTITNDVFTELNPIPFNNPTTPAYCCLSSDGIYLIIATQGSIGEPAITMYKRTEGTFGKAITIELAHIDPNKCVLSDDGVYLVVSLRGMVTRLFIYKRNGDIFTSLPYLETSHYVNNLSFSADGVYLAESSDASPYVTIYKRTGDTFTKLPMLEVTPNAGRCCAFSADGVYLAVGHRHFSSSIYRRNGDTFTKLPDPQNVSDPIDCSLSQDGTYLTTTYWRSPYITLHKRDGDIFKQIPIEAPPYKSYSCSFSPNGTYLVNGRDDAPFISVYKATNQYQAIIPTVKRTDKDIFKGIAIESGKAGETKQILITEKY